MAANSCTILSESNAEISQLPQTVSTPLRSALRRLTQPSVAAIIADWEWDRT